MPTYACDLTAVREAAARIKGTVHRTPVMTCDEGSPLSSLGEGRSNRRRSASSSTQVNRFA